MSCYVYYVTRPTQNRFQAHAPKHALLSARQRGEIKPHTLDDAVHTEEIFETHKIELTNKREKLQKMIGANRKTAKETLILRREEQRREEKRRE
jgi:hypothetical protein